jgi:hypothetical protein
MSSATPAVSSECVIPGASFTTNVSTAQTINIAIDNTIPRSILY